MLKSRNILEVLVNIVIDNLILWPFYYPIVYFMKEVRAGNKAKSNGLILLALNADRFRGDLEVLSGAGFKVYILPYKWQTRVFYAYKDKDRNSELFLNPPFDSPLYKDRIRLRRHLSCILRLLINNKKIDCVISAGLFYNQDFDWGWAARNIASPYVVFHRENIIGSKYKKIHNIGKAKLLKKIGFVGTSIVFHNKGMKDVFDKYSGVDADNIFALGALRMDEFIRKSNSRNNLVNNKRITLFSFSPSSVIFSNLYSDDFGWHKLHYEVHTSFVELAIEYPEIEFVIKHKGVDWRVTEELLRNMHAFKLNNLKIYGPSYDSQKLILESDVLTGFSSTAVLEAGITGKPVVYPLFSEASNIDYKDFIYFSENLSKMFDVAVSRNIYKQLIIKRYKNSAVSELAMKYRRMEFERNVSPLKANSLELYTNLLFEITSR